MKWFKLLFVALLIFCFCIACNHDDGGKKENNSQAYASLTDVVAYQGMTYVADAGQACIHVIDSAKNVSKIQLSVAPSAIAMDSEGKFLYVVGGEAIGQVVCIDLTKEKVTAQSAIGHTPTDVLCHDGAIYIAERFSNTLRKVDAMTLETVAVVETVREPVAVTVADNKLYVAAHLPEEAAVSEVIASDVGVHAASDLSPTTSIQLTNGSTGARGITSSPDGKYVYVTHTLGRYNVATTHLDRGWVYTNAVSVIEVKNQKLLASVLLDDIDLGAANPWGILCTDKAVVTAIAGTGEIIALDANRLVRSIKGSDDATSIADTLDFAHYFKQRVDLGESGVRAVAQDGNTYIVANYYDGTVTFVDAETLSVTAEVNLATETAPSAVRLGEILWNDASMCYQQWMTCASCHPDGRSDSLNWDNLNDGMGTPKQARTMLYTFDRGRVMATGVRPDAATAVRAGVKYICFNDGVTDEELQQLGEYVKSLKAVDSPYLVNGRLSEKALKGKELFEGKANCASCHANAIYGQDVLVENFTQVDNESRGLLVPSLIEVWRTAPYLYDGRAESLYEVLTKYNPLDENGKTKHGNVSDLTEEEVDALIEFVLSLTEKKSS